MMLSMKTVGVLVMAGFSLTACTTAQEALQAEGAVLMSKAELETLLTGNTVEFLNGNGSSYYSQGGAYLAKWKGDLVDGTWRVTEDSVLCFTVEEWYEGKEECGSTYYKTDVGYTILTKKGTKFTKVAEDFTPGNSI